MKRDSEVMNEILTERFDLEEIEQYKAIRQEYRANPVRRLADSMSSYMSTMWLFQSIMWWLLICLLIDLAKNSWQGIDHYAFMGQVPFVFLTAVLILVGLSPKPGGIPFKEFIHRIFRERTTMCIMMIVSAMVYACSLVLLCALCLAGVI